MTEKKNELTATQQINHIAITLVLQFRLAQTWPTVFKMADDVARFIEFNEMPIEEKSVKPEVKE
jgi:hypothetical protein